MLGDDLVRRYAKAGALSLAVSMEGIFEAEGKQSKVKRVGPTFRLPALNPLSSNRTIYLFIDFLICKMEIFRFNSIYFTGWFQGSNEFIHVNHLELAWYRVSSQYQRKVKSLSHVQLVVTLWTIAYQAALSMGFSRQGYWSGLPFPSPGDLPNPGIESRSPTTLQADALPSEPPGTSQYQGCH